MPNTLLTSKRMFQVWSYSVSHSSLLIRSVKTDDHPTRIDILFKPVAEMYLPNRLQELTLVEVPAPEDRSEYLEWDEARFRDRTLFLLRERSKSWYIVSMIAAIHEDDGEYFEPSHFDSQGLTG